MQVFSAKDASSDRSSSSSSSSSSASSSSSWATSSASSSYPLFNRTKELAHLAELCSAEPDSISVILGPRSAGKTVLLKEFMCRQGLLDSRCFIDAREKYIKTPSALASALLKSAIPKLAQQLFPHLKGEQLAQAAAADLSGVAEKQKSADGSELSISGVVIAPIIKALAGDVSLALETPPLAVILEAYIALLDAWNKARAAGSLKKDMPPVLVVDEANVLMAWGDQYKAEREALLAFFVAITKATRRSHVILATSEYSFQRWLSKGEPTSPQGNSTPRLGHCWQHY
jgi:AAA+ ATPase superfamily predicted ATPase